ncbi:hypothetical protein P344_02300 [Spiroplasma mirum ATCC 29335]|uniref:Uncharacterized protein n=1 Tax=Spiroplasma mirum ATCC 29335 TaxID=838561 RepID=W6AKX5_9MOLU|nr:hypothetical protein P344_02300 [Spiroplasma mirum ATCC 29335]
MYDLNNQILPNFYLHLVDCHQHLLWSALDTVTKSGIEERSVGINEDKFYIELFKKSWANFKKYFTSSRFTTILNYSQY